MPKMGAEHFDIIYVGDGAGHYVKVAVLTTTQRDALTGVEGMVIFNSTTDQLEEYDGATWEAVGQVILDTHTADLDAHTRNPLEILRTGEYYLPVHGVEETIQISADTLYVFPFIAARDMTADRIAVEVTGAGAGGTKIRLGIYNDGTNLYPGTLLLDAGKVAADAVAVAPYTINQALTKGLYWVGLVSDGTPTIRSTRDFDWLPLGVLSTQLNRGITGWNLNHTYAALPDPFTAGATQNNYRMFCIALRFASLD